MKRRIKKGVIIKFSIVILVIIITIVSIFTVKYLNSNEYKLTKIGYSKEQAKEIISLNIHIDDILKMDFNDKIIEILKSTYYIDNNFLDYISYYNNNKDKSINDVIAIINVKANKPWYSDVIETDISKGNLMLVNKFHRLPSDYNPEDIVKIKDWYAYEGHSIKQEVYDSFISMYNDAKKVGLSLIINSSYRTHEVQQTTYDSIKDTNGGDYADSYAARPDHSEHQSALAFDIVKPGTFDNDFEQTEEYSWLLNNAHKYGFILRYPKGKEYLTGYAYESWHYRYVGTEVAQIIYEKGITFDEYYAYYIGDK